MPNDQLEFDAQYLQARWVLGGVESEEMAAQAILALEQNRDCPALRMIAGLVNPTRGDLGTLPDRAFFELGLPKMDVHQAGAVVADRHKQTCNSLITELLTNFPEFSLRWTALILDWHGNPPGTYNEMAQFVRYVMEDLYEKEALPQVQRAFDFMEEAVASGDQNTRDLVGLGFFETLQCVASHRSYGNQAFEPFLGPTSRKIWDELRRMWRGKSSLMDVIRARKKPDG